MATQGVGVGQVAMAAVVALAREVSVLAFVFVRTVSSVSRLPLELSIPGYQVSVQAFVLSVLGLTLVIEVSVITSG